MRTSTLAALLLLLLVLVAAPAGAQMGDPTKVNLKVTPVAGPVSMIEGADGFAGGNVGVLVGDEGVVLIDDDLQPVSPKLKAALAGLSKKPVRFVINTHWHGDHTGGNLAMGSAGAVLVAHDNVRKRLSVDQFMEFMGQKNHIPASPPGALPVVTFAEDVTIHLDGEELHAVHVPPAHTDGDVVVQFKKANVISAGDVFIGGYPLVDVSSGGKFDGFITAADKLLSLCDDKTRIIPGHGPVMGKAELQAWRDMLVTVRGRVVKLLLQKKSLEQIKAAKPTAEFDAARSAFFVKPEMLLETMQKTIDPKAPAPGAKK
jgi:cyclase